MTSYFFDTYALIEIAKGNPNYEQYRKSTAVISVLNILEMHYHFAKKFGGDIANVLLTEYSKCVISFGNKDIIAMTDFKISNAKKSFSLPDSLGYVLAIKHGIKFLTGDEGFKGMPNVEFVK
jgi:uncharacterized protein